MVDEHAAGGYGRSDTRSTDQVTPEERILKTVEELAARWHRRRTHAVDAFQAGMMHGWSQSIALLLGQPHHRIVAALEEGQL